MSLGNFLLKGWPWLGWDFTFLLIKSTSSGEREREFGKLFAKGLALAWGDLHFPFLLKV